MYASAGEGFCVELRKRFSHTEVQAVYWLRRNIFEWRLRDAD